MRSYPLLSRFVLFLVVPLVALLATVAWYARASIGPAEGRVEICCVGAPVSIARDDHDTVYIRAQSDHDAFFALGFAQAQDRLWQLELLRRIVQGRTSEVFGKESLEADVWFRTLDLGSAAAAAWPGLSREAQRSLQAYADGVNAWVAQGHPLPPEFVLLGMRPTPWRPADSLGVIKLFALTLGGNFRSEIEHFIAASQLSAPELAALYPGYPIDAPVTVRDAAPAMVAQLARLHRLTGMLESKWQLGGPFVGSNAWVVAGRLTEGGTPIMANDPHLGLQIPSPWYAVDMAGDHLKVSGMTLVGLPVVISGKNQSITWSSTNMMADVQDLYLERTNALDAQQYWDQDAWRKFDTRTETITVKPDFPAALQEAQPPVKITVRRTVHGPVISDVIAQGVFDRPVALRWNALDPDDTSYEALFRLNYAQNWTAFQDALQFHVAPAQNVLYADRAGNIGYVGVGRIPVRNKGNGSAPVPGDDPAYRWTGTIPFKDMPRSFNPPQGFIVSANNKVVGNDYPYFISNEWAPPARARRIEAMIEQAITAGQPLSFAATEGMQADVLNLEAKQMLPVLTALTPDNQPQREALDLLAHWDARMGTGSPAATLYTVWMRHLRIVLFASKFKGDWNQPGKASVMNGLVGSISTDAVQAALRPGALDWCQTQGHPATCDTKMKLALDDALRELRKLRGASMQDWEWGKVHHTVFEHKPFSRVKLLAEAFERTASGGGASGTVNAANAAYREGEGYLRTLGPSFRLVMQPGGALRFINSTGQSGNPLSSHYDDQIPLYMQGRYIEFDAQHARQTVTLTPRP